MEWKVTKGLLWHHIIFRLASLQNTKQNCCLRRPHVSITVLLCRRWNRSVDILPWHGRHQGGGTVYVFVIWLQRKAAPGLRSPCDVMTLPEGCCCRNMADSRPMLSECSAIKPWHRDTVLSVIGVFPRSKMHSLVATFAFQRFLAWIFGKWCLLTKI